MKHLFTALCLPFLVLFASAQDRSLAREGAQDVVAAYATIIDHYEAEIKAKEAQFNEQVAAYKRAQGAGKETARVKAELIAYEIFDLKMKMREEELKMLEAQMNQVKENIEFRKNNRAKIVDRYVQDNLSE